MKNLKVTPYHFNELIVKGYSLDLIFLLKLIESKHDVKPLCQESQKIDVLYKCLIRKGLITEHDDKITVLGNDLLEFMETKEPKKLVRKKVDEDGGHFERWWKEYPGTDIFTYSGKDFSGARTLRQNKEECRNKFEKILMEGEYTAEQLIEALKFDVLQKKESSLKTGTNKLTYMQNSLTYLNQRSFEPFIELIKEGGKIIPTYKPAGGTDI